MIDWLTRLFGRRPRPRAPVPVSLVSVRAPVAGVRVGIGAHRCDDVEAGWLQRLGVGHVRTTYYTHEAQTVENYDEAFDRFRLQRLRTLGMEPLVVVWDFPPAGDAEVAATMRHLVQRFPGTLWQVGNEYDAQAWSPWNTGTAYARLMSVVVPAMLLTDPTCRIVGCGLACTMDDDVARQTRFLADYRTANGPTLTAWCIHTYGLPLGARFASLTRTTHTALRGWMPLWVTEFGVEAAQVFAAYGVLLLTDVDCMQADAWRDVLDAAARCQVERVYGYQLWTDEDDGHGIVRKDGTERPACDALRASLTLPVGAFP